MNSVARILIFAGVVLIVVGVLWQIGSRFLHLGRLPGDIVIERDQFRFYFPIVTSILLSVVLTLLLWLFQWWNR